MSFLTPKFIEKQKIKLLTEKQRIINSLAHFKNETKKNGAEVFSEEGDMAQQYLTEKLNMSLRDRDLAVLQEIDFALNKIVDGTYGYCEESGEPIEMKRLEKQPWARLSLHYAELEEIENQKYNTKKTTFTF